MKTEKKKPGRPGKNKSRDFLTPNEIITAKNEIIADLEARLDSAYKEQEDMLKELDRNLNMVKYHCQQVEATTGELIQEDIAYCANLVNRIMKHKFGYKPQTQEL